MVPNNFRHVLLDTNNTNNTNKPTNTKPTNRPAAEISYVASQGVVKAKDRVTLETTTLFWNDLTVTTIAILNFLHPGISPLQGRKVLALPAASPAAEKELPPPHLEN